MTTVEVTWESNEVAMPAGSEDDDHYKVSLDGAGHYEVDAPLSASFATIDDVAPGSYVATVQTIGVNGNNVGDPSNSAPFEILDIMVHVRIPANVQGRAVP